jgi:hypothetical protein
MRNQTPFARLADALEEVGLQGSAWQCVDGLPCPTIYGNRRRAFDEVIGVRVGDVYEARKRGERYFFGLDESFIARVAKLHGTELPWTLVYCNTTNG